MATTSSPLRTLPALAAALLLAPVAARAGDALQAASKAPVSLPAPASFASAVDALEKATGAKGEKLPFGDVPLTEGRSFSVEPALAGRLLAGSHGTFRKAGLFLFRYERSYGMAGDKDRIGLLKTADPRVVIRRVGTGQGHGPASERIVAWLDDLAKEEPFELSEIGVDYLAGEFAHSPKDARAVAKRCAEFAPDLVAGRATSLDLLAEEIRANRTLYLIW